MYKLSPLNTLVAATLIVIATGNAWSGEATPAVPAAPASQTAAPGAGYVPGWYPPTPDRRGYAQPRPQPSQQPVPPPGYGQLGPYSSPYGQYRTGPDVPAENPLSAKLKQTQEQLATQTTELETTREQLTRLQTELQTATAALQKAQSDTINAGRQVDTTKAQEDTFRKILCELAARIETRNTALQDALQAPAAEPDDPDSAAVGEADSEATDQAEPLTDLQCTQLTPPPAITSGQRGVTVKTQAR